MEVLEVWLSDSLELYMGENGWIKMGEFFGMYVLLKTDLRWQSFLKN